MARRPSIYSQLRQHNTWMSVEMNDALERIKAERHVARWRLMEITARLVLLSIADLRPRLALEESRVRWMRRWLMWAAVSVATMGVRTPVRFAAFVGTLVLAVGLLAAWPLGWLSGRAMPR